ncbi:hypothetical protein [Mycolicibacterium sp.]|uniref:hypothetical protein n=1 Tax=Mycolicibacterium sp. TaxID=2320850 RepID=UPI0037C4F1DF
MTAGDWINLAGVVVSFSSAVWAVVSAVRARRAEAAAAGFQTLAATAARDAAAAQKEAASAAERAAAALEEQNRVVAEHANAAERVSWRIVHRSGAKWELWNDSVNPKFRVNISGPGVSTKQPPPTIPHMDGHSSSEFWGTTSYGAVKRADVTWRASDDDDAPELRWSGAMPEAQ